MRPELFCGSLAVYPPSCKCRQLLHYRCCRSQRESRGYDAVVVEVVFERLSHALTLKSVSHTCNLSFRPKQPTTFTTVPPLRLCFFSACGPTIQLLDQFLIADEFKLRTIIFGQIYGAIYIAFNVGWYYLAPREERLIYFILDWDEKPLVASIYALGCVLVLGPILGVLHYGVYRCSSKPLLLFPSLHNRSEAGFYRLKDANCCSMLFAICPFLKRIANSLS